MSINTFRADGWMTVNDEPTLVRVLAGGGEVLVTSYWPATDPAASMPPLKLERLQLDGAAAGPFDTSGGAAGGAPFAAPGIAAWAAPLGGPAGGMGIGPGGGPMGGQPGGQTGGPAGGLAREGATGLLSTSFATPQAAPRSAEVVAHIEGVGDIDGRFGDWVGMRGSGRAIEGFSLAPRQGISPDDFELRAVLGRDWLSPWLPGGNFCGSRGLALPLRGFCLRLHPAVAARFDLACYARFVDGAEVGPIGTDHLCAAPNLPALEAFQILLRPRVP